MSLLRIARKPENNKPGEKKEKKRDPITNSPNKPQQITPEDLGDGEENLAGLLEEDGEMEKLPWAIQVEKELNDVPQRPEPRPTREQGTYQWPKIGYPP